MDELDTFVPFLRITYVSTSFTFFFLIISILQKNPQHFPKYANSEWMELFSEVTTNRL